MFRPILRVACCLTLLLAACAPATIQSYQAKDPVEAQIIGQLIKIPNGLNARNLELMMQPYADDVYIANFSKYLGVAGPSAPLSISKTELRAAYGQIFRSVNEISMDVKDLKLTVSGDRATVDASTELLFKQQRGRKESKEGDVYRNEVIWRMKRTPLGWRIIEEVWQ
jgi:ketosteroid isomerase-like protein